MDLDFTEDEARFRDEVRAFLAERLPTRIASKMRTGVGPTKQDMEEWHAILHARGWLAGHWPAEWGGAGWTVVQRYIFDTETALAWAPRVVPFGVNMLGPVLIRYGSEVQKRHWLPRILDGSDWWCQGFSEPGAGSDLASLKCSAVRQGDHYVVNGQKTWTTLGQHANKIFCLVRTDPAARKQRGISFLLIDMETPGVEVRPIILLDGEHEVNEVFFSDVRVPVENLVGAENEGWACAKYLLTHERTGIAGVGQSMAAFQRLLDIVDRQRKDGRPLAADPYIAARIARIEIELENMKTTNLRVLASVVAGGAPDAESSMLKVRGTEIRQEIASLSRRALGAYAQISPMDMAEDLTPGWSRNYSHIFSQYLNLRKLSIFGGSSEIQKNIIAKTLLGL